MQNVETGWFWGLWVTKVTGNVTINRAHMTFYLSNRNYAFILYRFRVILSYLSEVAYFNLPCLHAFGTPGGVTPFEFGSDFWYQQTFLAMVWRCFHDPKFTVFKQYQCV